MTTTMMQCGHTANGTDQKTGSPVCGTCIGLVAGADKIATMPDLTGRTAPRTRGKTVGSEGYTYLAFFRHQPDRDRDEFYCGHSGWD